MVSNPMTPAKAAAPARGPSILFVLNPAVGRNSCQVRAQLFQTIFQDHGWKVDYATWTHEPSRYEADHKNEAIARLAKDYDIVYLIKVPSLRFIRRVQLTSRARVVFDLNDALWTKNHNAGWRDFNAILRAVDAVFAENEYLARYARARSAFVRTVPDSIPLERFDALRSGYQAKNGEKIIIGWVGSTSTLGALKAIQGPLEHVFEHHANLELHILGCSDVNLLPGFRHVRYRIFPDGYDEEVLVRHILGLDIGLFPPPFDLSEYCARGLLKAVLYMGGGVPCICQRAGDAERLIQDEINGMLAGTSEEWVEKLEALIISPRLRREIGKGALETVRAQRALTPVFAQFEAALLELLSSGHRPLLARPSLMIRFFFFEAMVHSYTFVRRLVRKTVYLFRR